MVSFRLPDEHLDPFQADTRQQAPTNTSPLRRISPPPGLEYASVFDSDDEDSSDESCFDLSFPRKPVTPPTPLSIDGARAKTVQSLLTIGLRRHAEIAASTQALIDEVTSSQQPAVTHHANDEYHIEQQTTSESLCNLSCLQEQNQEQQLQLQPNTNDAVITSNTLPAMAFSPAQHLRSGLLKIFGAVKHAVAAMIQLLLNIIDELLPHPEPEAHLDNFYIPYTSSVYSDPSSHPQSLLPSDQSDYTSGSDLWSQEDDESDDDNATSPPGPIPLTAAQKEQKAEWDNHRISPHDAWVNDSKEIARAGPMGENVTRPSGHGDQDGKHTYAYVEKDDRPWWCCSCCAANTRWEFLCSGCGAHIKADCCQEVVEDGEGVAGFGVAGSW